MSHRLFMILFSAALVASCTTKDERYYVGRGEEVKRQLIVELEGARSLHDLFARQETLALLFDELSKVAVEARMYQLRSKTTWDVPRESSQSSQDLAQQMR